MPEPRRAFLVLLMLLVAGCTFRPPAATEPPETTPRPSPTPSPTAAPSLSDASEPTPLATPAPTPDPAGLELEVFSCPGGVVLHWSASTNPEFHHYTALRSPEREIAQDWPPVAPAVDWGQTYATDRFVTSAVDASIFPSDTMWHYRVMAYNAKGRSIAASPVRTAQIRPPVEMGTLESDVGEDGVIGLTWRPYTGADHCFTAYRVLAGAPGGPLSTLTIVSDQAADTLETGALDSGATYELRVEAVRTTTLGSIVLGQTDALTLTVP